MDPRATQAQQLFWEIETLRRQHPGQPPVTKLTQMAQLHQERALELLNNGDADGWTDLYAAVTAWGEAGARKEAEHLLSVGRQLAAALPDGRANVEGQLNDLEQWLSGLTARNGANGAAPVGKATLARLGERIEECLTLARTTDAAGLERVIDLLSQAHDEVVQLEQQQSAGLFGTERDSAILEGLRNVPIPLDWERLTDRWGSGFYLCVVEFEGMTGRRAFAS